VLSHLHSHVLRNFVIASTKWCCKQISVVSSNVSSKSRLRRAWHLNFRPILDLLRYIGPWRLYSTDVPQHSGLSLHSPPNSKSQSVRESNCHMRSSYVLQHSHLNPHSSDKSCSFPWSDTLHNRRTRTLGDGSLLKSLAESLVLRIRSERYLGDVLNLHL
jgi:hypothetical protein